MRRSRQAIRLQGLLKALQEGEHPHVEHLAARFNVRRETIYRDLRVLEEVGFPISGDAHGVKSHPRLLAGSSITTVSIPFTIGELLAFAFAASATDSFGGTQLHDDLQTAVAKVKTHIPGRELDRLALTSPLFSPYQKGAKSYQSHRTTIATLCQAMLERRRCLVEYQSPQRDAPSRFQLDPYRLFEFHGGLYLFAFVPAHRAVITLAVERIKNLTPTDDPFTIIKGFSFEALRDKAFGVTSEEPMNVVLRFRKDQAPYIRERIWHPTQNLTELRNGDLRLSFRAGGKIEIIRWILSWGSAATVLQPKALRQLVAEELRTAGTLYR
ncbi:MAG: WYL domain-containing protein [candidate division NC10 bacterium]|nr:WYL domain-containing protein [candidate division NC10 bacterium]MDE2321353.1 WYL domain-containing protein [candidate division NC10 bacterium]